MKILIGIVLMGLGTICLIGLIAYIWTFEIIYLRLWLTAMVLGGLLLRVFKILEND